jgi:hypothetical protein
MPGSDKCAEMLSSNNPSFDERWDRLYGGAKAQVLAKRQAEAGTGEGIDLDVGSDMGNSALSQTVAIKPVQESLF